MKNLTQEQAKARKNKKLQNHNSKNNDPIIESIKEVFPNATITEGYEETKNMLNDTQPTTQEVQPVLVTPAAQDKAFTSVDTTITSVNELQAKLADFKEKPVVPSIAEVKETRGRKKGSKNKPPVTPIENFVPKPEQPVFAGALISGALALSIIDAFLPWLISIVHNKIIDKHSPIDAKDLKLPTDVKNDLKLAADEAIKSSNIKITPAQALFFSLASAYALAYGAAVTKAKPKPPVKNAAS